MPIKLFILIITILSSFLLADAVSLSTTQEPTNILKQAQIYVDKENKHDFDYVLEHHKKLFEKNEKDFLHLGYSPDALWLKFSIKNDTNATATKVLELSNNILDNAELFTEQNAAFTSQIIGMLHNRNFDEKLLNFYFDISLKPQETLNYYLKVSSLSCAVFFELTLMDKEQLYQKELQHQLILALFFASIVTLILYNLSIYFFTKDLAYLYYVLYLFFTGANHFSYTSFNLYILPQSLYKTDAFLAITYLSFSSIFALLFVREFLNIKRYKKLDFILKILLAIFAFFILFTSPAFYPLDTVVLTAVASLIYLIGISLYLLYKGEANARYMIFGWFLAAFGWIMLGAYDYGFWSPKYSYPYFFEVCIFTEAILFSVALANRLNKAKELEKSLQTNTILTRELHHRIKNNMQFILSMYRLKLAKFSTPNISNALREIEGTIQAMSTTHEMLYTQNITETIDTNEYLSRLLSKLKQSYQTQEIKMEMNINAALSMDVAIYVGILFNELLSNSLKYAFEEEKGEIFISLLQQNNQYELVFIDNGKGFNPQEKGDTFGLELITTLVEDELHGKLDITSNSSGTKYTIVWS